MDKCYEASNTVPGLIVSTANKNIQQEKWSRSTYTGTCFHVNIRGTANTYFVIFYNSKISVKKNRKMRKQENIAFIWLLLAMFRLNHLSSASFPLLTNYKVREHFLFPINWNKPSFIISSEIISFMTDCKFIK